MKKPKPKKKEKVFETRRAAFRAAKRDLGLPVTSQPNRIVKPNTEEWTKRNLDYRNRRLYIFELLLRILGFSRKRELHIREDKEALMLMEAVNCSISIQGK
jgi:hypothetical protein